MNLVERVKRILLAPRPEWEVIDAEPTTPAALYTGYVIPLAAIGPIASIVGLSLFGLPFIGRLPIGSLLASAIVGYVLALVGIFVMALIIDALAPTFGGQRSQIQALKVAAYSATASWVGGIFGLIPALSILGALFGIYSLYLLYLGLPVLMRAPKEKALGYTAVVILVAIVLYFVIGTVAARFMMYPRMSMPA